MALEDPAFSSPSMPGMTIREFAAIKLGMPDSGDDDLDVMIKKSNRRAFYRAIVTSVFGTASRSESRDAFAKDVRELSDAVVAAVEAEEENNGF